MEFAYKKYQEDVNVIHHHYKVFEPEYEQCQ